MASCTTPAIVQTRLVLLHLLFISLIAYLYDLGLMLQGDASLRVFDNGFRPWPHVYKNKGRSANFYNKIDLNLDTFFSQLPFLSAVFSS
jgi:hypothetical protein